MRSYRTVSTASVMFAIVLGAAAAQSSERAPAGAVTVIMVDGYPAFNPPAVARNGRPTIEVRAFVFRQAPWSLENPAILLNPAHANAETLHIAIRALIQSNAAGGTGMILVSNRSALEWQKTGRPVPPELSARLEELRIRPVGDVANMRRQGRQITIEDFAQYR